MDELSSSLIVDADKVEGVVAVIPSTVEPVRLLDGYSNEKLVSCAFCRQKQKHYRGFFVELSDGKLALAGNCCATKIGGKDEVEKISKSVASKEKVANVVAEKRALFDALSLLKVETCNDWLPVEQQINKTIAEVSSFFGILQGPKTYGFQRTISQCNDALSKFDQYHQSRDRITEQLSIACTVFSRAYADLATLALHVSRSRLGSTAVNNPRFGERNCTLLDDQIICSYKNEFGEDIKTVLEVPRIVLPADTTHDLLARIKAIHRS